MADKTTTYKVSSLTKEQVDLIPGFRDAWLKVALSTEPVNRATAEKGLQLAYTTVGEKIPKVEWLSSPLKGAIAATLLSEDKKVGEPLGKRLWAVELDQAREAVVKQVSPNVLRIVKTELMDHIAEQVAAIVVPVAIELEQRASALKMSGAEQIVRELLGQAVFGSFDASWFSFYDYMDRVLDIKECKRLKGLFMAARGGWYWPFGGVVIATEHPSKILFDEKNKPHCADGIAVEYPDGFGAYVWHGTRVPQESILTPDDVKWADVEATADKDLKDALAEIKALRWAAKPKEVTAEVAKDETEDERYEAAMAVKRLGGISSLKDMVEDEKGTTSDV